MEYKWQGEKVVTKFGYSIVTADKGRPLCWYNYECDINAYGNGTAKIPAIQISYGNITFVIANHFGNGVYKLIHGGWPDSSHMSLPDESFIECDEEWCNIKEFDMVALSDHEKKRMYWQKVHAPEEYAKMEEMRKAMMNNPILKNSRFGKF